MIFLISFDRKTGTTLRFDEFGESDMAEVQKLRLDLELAAARSDDAPEIVILRAPSKEDLRKTHTKYFGIEALRESIAKLTA